MRSIAFSVLLLSSINFVWADPAPQFGVVDTTATLPTQDPLITNPTASASGSITASSTSATIATVTTTTVSTTISLLPVDTVSIPTFTSKPSPTPIAPQNPSNVVGLPFSNTQCSDSTSILKTQACGEAFSRSILSTSYDCQQELKMAMKYYSASTNSTFDVPGCSCGAFNGLVDCFNNFCPDSSAKLKQLVTCKASRSGRTMDRSGLVLGLATFVLAAVLLL
ncbi:hypothetical protein HDU97_006842 [Phlyctochytrium planicorne]|nr:hypothetical protein HDU97_006842 [Phlyctochytrium planicorne]